jgi:hypothetical protein
VRNQISVGCPAVALGAIDKLQADDELWNERRFSFVLGVVAFWLARDSPISGKAFRVPGTLRPGHLCMTFLLIVFQPGK